VKSITLAASSSAGIPVYYYVKEGPAEIKTNKLEFTKIPIRSKYPVKVIVVAWQYGRIAGDKIKSAEPIKQSFYISK
jgi:hypothetical protein